MIQYKSDGMHFLVNVFRLHGSVFPKAMVIALPGSIITALFVACIYEWELDQFEYFKDPQSVMSNNVIWGGFSSLAGFLVVFRTSQAYQRFWEGITSTHMMGAEWFDCCANLVAFCKFSTAEEEPILEFQNTLVRLFSMLHAAALGGVEESSERSHYSELAAYRLELIDPEGIDEESLRSIRDSNAKVELIFEWIHQLIVESVKAGVLNIAPPILTRAFQELASGMVHFNDALKISTVPFPFPYTQTCDCLLLLHWVLVPFVVSQWCTNFAWAGIFSFMQVFTLWSLNLIASELENPFGTDPNDMDGLQLQLTMNNSLRLLLRPSTKRTPKLRLRTGETMQDMTQRAIDVPEEEPVSFAEVWNVISVATECCSHATRRFAPDEVIKKRCSQHVAQRPSEHCGAEASHAGAPPSEMRTLTSHSTIDSDRAGAAAMPDDDGHHEGTTGARGLPSGRGSGDRGPSGGTCAASGSGSSRFHLNVQSLLVCAARGGFVVRNAASTEEDVEDSANFEGGEDGAAAARVVDLADAGQEPLWLRPTSPEIGSRPSGRVEL